MNEFYLKFKEFDTWSVYQINAIGPVLQYEGTYYQCNDWVTERNGKLIDEPK